MIRIVIIVQSGYKMEFDFSFLKFVVSDEKIYLKGCENKLFPFTEINVAGENKDSHFGVKTICASESDLRYVSHGISNNSLAVVQQGKRLRVSTYFRRIPRGDCVSIYTEIENVSENPVVVDQVSAFVYTDICTLKSADKTTLYRFKQSHHAECLPQKATLYDLGLIESYSVSQKRIFGVNIGSWSTKEELPQGILEHNGRYTMFRIESNHSWYYEISDLKNDNVKYVYLYLGGATGTFGDFWINLKPGDKFSTPTVTLSVSESLNGVIGETTKYIRANFNRNAEDENLPVIFNEYMHLSWDNPTEEKTKKYVPKIAELGAKYYVIDCGWHNEEDSKDIFSYVGQWKESKKRFPSGVRAITDYIRAHGMKAGLWIEPEIVGYKCKEMLDYYDDDCFLTRYGKRICVMGRYFLNFRNKKVIDYLNETIRRMVEDYGAEYIKTDYNQDLGVGCDTDGGLGLGICEDRKAYLDWIDSVSAKYPDVIFETCSSGGMRMDGETLKRFSLVSTSDQINYKRYPYISANVLAAVLPEQAAVWSYPVAGDYAPEDYFVPTEEWTEENVDEEKIIMNMINSFLGRMHLASDLRLLRPEKLSLVKEGIEYYDYLTQYKRIALPYFINGFTKFGEKSAASGFKTGNKIFLAVWNLGGEKNVTVSLDEKIKKVTVGYPKKSVTDFKVEGNKLTVKFPSEYSARFFEITVG